jgi:hypothetical protein
VLASDFVFQRKDPAYQDDYLLCLAILDVLRQCFCGALLQREWPCGWVHHRRFFVAHVADSACLPAVSILGPVLVCLVFALRLLLFRAVLLALATYGDDDEGLGDYRGTKYELKHLRDLYRGCGTWNGGCACLTRARNNLQTTMTQPRHQLRVWPIGAPGNGSSPS